MGHPHRRVSRTRDADHLHDPGQPGRRRRRRVAAHTDLSVATGTPSLTNCTEGTPEAGFPDEIAPQPQDYVFLKRRPSAFYGTGVAELLRLLNRSGLVIGGGATNRGVETSVREAFSMDLDTVVVRECCWGGDAAAHAYSLDTSMKMYARVRSLEQALAMLRA
jgi:maleamate amidohydrolase